MIEWPPDGDHVWEQVTEEGGCSDCCPRWYWEGGWFLDGGFICHYTQTPKALGAAYPGTSGCSSLVGDSVCWLPLKTGSLPVSYTYIWGLRRWSHLSGVWSCCQFPHAVASCNTYWYMGMKGTVTPSAGCMWLGFPSCSSWQPQRADLHSRRSFIRG